MNDIKKSKLNKFANDAVMVEAVYEVLLDSFLKERVGADVYILAASRLSVDHLKQGWRELEKYKNIEDDDAREIKNQIGL